MIQPTQQQIEAATAMVNEEAPKWLELEEPLPVSEMVRLILIAALNA